jgi:predicted sulfurtransferase
MRFILMMSAVFLVGAGILTGCQNAAQPVKVETAKTNPTPAVQQAPDAHDHEAEEKVPRINVQEAKKEFDAGNTVFIDTRAEATYKVEHIKGAINITMDTVEQRYKNIPKGKKIIAYCS